MTPYETQLAHLVTMAKIPGCKAYAWDRAKKLEADQCGLWAGLTQALTDEMRKHNEKKHAK